MKKKILLVVLAALLAGGLNAQSEKETKKKEKGKFGAFLGKLGEQTTGINMTNEPFIVNPLSSSCDVELVGLYGNMAGTVTLVFRMRNKTDIRPYIGGEHGKGVTAAYDAKGKIYKSSSYHTVYNAPKGIWTEICLDGSNVFRNVPVELSSFELINIHCYFGGQSGLIEFRNIPIQWGVDPE